MQRFSIDCISEVVQRRIINLRNFKELQGLIERFFWVGGFLSVFHPAFYALEEFLLFEKKRNNRLFLLSLYFIGKLA